MQVKSLKILGFKSFHNQTEISFHEGVNAIVGPNGCGKSNICDAIKWVLGEPNLRQIRGEKIEDIIFNGSHEHKPLGMAEVTMVIENNGTHIPQKYSEFTELEVTRRVFRSGESEFFINRNPCLLKDIRELFMDTGLNPRAYAVIEQGAISGIVNSSPQDLRKLLEEAAGITKYRERKSATSRKLAATGENLSRVQDIILEVTRQVRSTRRQANEAERYMTFQNELKKIEAVLYFHQYDELRKCWEEAAKNHAQWSRQADDARHQMTVVEAKAEGIRTDLLNLEKKISDIQETFYRAAGQIEVSENRISYLEEKRDDFRQRQSDTAENIHSSGERRRRTEQDLEKIRQEIQVLSAGIEERRSVLEKLRRNQSSSEDELKESVQKTEAARRRHNEIIGEIASLTEMITSAESRVNNYQVLLGRFDGEIEKLQEQAINLERERESLAKSLDQRGHSLESVTEKLIRATALEEEILGKLKDISSAIENKIRHCTEAGSLLESKISIRQKGDNLRKGSRTLLDLASRKDGPINGQLIGILGHLIDVDENYRKAFEALLSEKLEAVMVEDEASALRLVRELKHKKEGGATIVPGEMITSGVENRPSSIEGTLGPAWKFVRSVDKRVLDLVKAMLADVHMTSSLDDALAIRKSGPGAVTLCTLHGDILHAWGGLTVGNGREYSKGILGLNEEINALNKEVTLAKEELNNLRNKETALKEKLQQASKEREAFHRQRIELEQQIAGEKIRYEGLDSEHRQTLERKEVLEKDLEFRRQQHLKDLSDLDDYRLRLKDAEIRKGNLAEDLEKTNSEIDEKERYRVEIRETASGEAVALAASLEKEQSLIEVSRRMTEELDNACQHIEELQEESLRLQGEIKKAEEAIIDEHRSLEGLKEERDSASKQIEALQSRHGRMMSDQNEASSTLRDKRNEWEALSGKLSSASVEMAELKARMEEVQHRAHGETGRDFQDENWNKELERLLEIPADELIRKSHRLKGRVGRIGPINMAAVDEIKDLEDRLQFLSDQKSDLEEAIESLNSAIRKINRSSRERFSKTFQAVAENFSESFQLLFNGGEAELILEEGVDLLEAGIQIYAKPPGKKRSKLTLMSGGEKAMTALALLFALFAVRKPPFCLMDEVDAPLDDVNIDRFIKLVEATIDSSQIVFITHNKRTMEKADNLVGVTMESPGISKLVSVCLHTEN